MYMAPFKFLRKPDTDDDIKEHLRINIPNYIVACGEISAYLHGVDCGLMSMGYNPYHDNTRGEIWNRGFWNATNLIHGR